MMAMAPPPGRDDEDFSDSDQAWWDRVRGRSAGRAPTVDAEQEGELLRRALQAQRADEAAPDPALRNERWRRARARLQAEGLIQPPNRWQHAGWGAALAASLFAAVVLVQRPFGVDVIYDDPPTMRSQDLELITVPTNTPRADAEALLARLRDTGWKASAYQTRRSFFVDTTIDFDTPVPAREALVALGSRSGAGSVRVAFVPR
jgi:hypothetical protein